jgi:hypothetical protein
VSNDQHRLDKIISSYESTVWIYERRWEAKDDLYKNKN